MIYGYVDAEVCPTIWGEPLLHGRMSFGYDDQK